MSQENITIHLDDNHENGRKAVIRGYVRNKDRRKVQKTALRRQEISSQQSSSGDVEFTITGETAIELMETQVEALLLEYNGVTDKPFELLMESDAEDDYNKIVEAVQAVFHRNEDPKD